MEMGWISTEPEAHVGLHLPHRLVLMLRVSDLAALVESGCWSHVVGVN
jgi:hypothetical protein